MQSPTRCGEFENALVSAEGGLYGVLAWHV